MNDELIESECRKFKKQLEFFEDISEMPGSERLSLDVHLECCASCKAYWLQHKQILEMGAALMHFDVSEGLTQRILTSIEKEETPAIESSLLPLGLIGVFAFLLMVPFDSLQSLASWASGILGLYILQLLMNAAKAKEQVV
ncbi:MAG: hypothetical protein K2X27_16515 [Candidatus Obscuribacterales bacterium]|nr:hypothetical protein [Candidatus Obscuribacterales bacterium]